MIKFVINRIKQESVEPRSFRTRIHQLMLFTAIPFFVCIFVLMILFINTNRQYNNILNNLAISASFNADFQTTLDLKMYQVVINRDMFDELRPMDDIYYAQMIVNRLKDTSTDIESLRRLADIERYIDLLVKNINTIVENQGYEQNMEILDRRIRVLTMLVHQKMQEYIYNETRVMTEMRDDANMDFTVLVILFSVLFLVIAAAMTAAGLHMTKILTEPLNELSKNFKTVGEGDFSIQRLNAPSIEITVLHDAFRTMVAKIEELMEQIALDKDNLRLIEFQLLQSQINPHFLYNTFDAIIWLTEDGEYEKVKQLMNSLSNFCRITLSDGEDIISIKEEIQHIQSYLEIQQVRYYDVLTYRIDVPDEVVDYLIPKLSLQPIVENALYHGIKHKRGGGEITIKCEYDAESITFLVRDTGIGMTEEKLSQINNTISSSNDLKQGYGLINVFERLWLYYRQEVTFAITSVFNEFTEVKFTIPAHSKRSLER